MGLEEFADEVSREVAARAGREFDVRLTEAVKNNGVKLVGLAASRRGENGGPCIYLDGYYGEYLVGNTSTGEAAEDICSSLMEHMDDIHGTDLSGFCQWETVRGSIYPKLINTGMNRGLLADVPHRKFLDLAVVYQARVEGLREDGGISSILIHDSHMGMWGKDERCLYSEALKNMRTDGGPLFEPMEELLGDMIPIGMAGSGGSKAPGAGLYVLTNRHRAFGATEILDGETLKRISSMMGGSYVILPSSVHETIILPAAEAPQYSGLAAMVREINATQVDMEERLSDHVYLYEREEGILRIAA